MPSAPQAVPPRPALGGGKALVLVVPTAKKRPRPLSTTASVVFFMALMCPPGAPGGSWFGPECSPGGRCRAPGEAGPSRHQARRGRHVLVAKCSRFRSALIVLSTILPQRGAATSEHVSVARCRLDPRWFTEHHPMWRQHYVQWPKRVKDKRATQPAPDAAPLQRPASALPGR
jgi:hypothetical protein